MITVKSVEEIKLTDSAPYVKIDECRICHGKKFKTILDLGSQYIANHFYTEEKPTLQIPLRLIKCEECQFVQLEHSTNYSIMYKKYWYRSGINKTMTTHLNDLVQRIETYVKLETGDMVIDIGCNDCTLLGCYPKNIKRIGIDPSNIQPIKDNYDIHYNDYFSSVLLKDQPRAKVITSIAMFYDLNDPRKFVEDVCKCMHPDGIWILELSYLPTMMKAVSYDTICHEHVSYYRLSTFEQLLKGLPLHVIDIEFNDTNGGSVKFIVASINKKARPIVEEVRQQEKLITDETYAKFKIDTETSKAEILNFFKENKGKKIYGYGASTKGQVLMQYCGFTPEHMVAIADINQDKYDWFTPGTSIRICSEEEFRNDKPDYAIVFPWHFIPEILEREKSFMDNTGCKFVTPLPVFRIYS